MRIIGGWETDPLWGSAYDWMVEHPTIGGAIWAVGAQTNLAKLYATARVIGEQPDGARVLDVPCGGGVALRALKPDQQVEYVAADISPRMIERTRARAERREVAHLVTGEVADVHDLPFDDDSFDLVVSFTGLHCFPDPARAVVEMTRVLKPGGVIAGSTMLTDAGLRYRPMWRAGRLGGVLGPGCSATEVRLWLTGQDVQELSLEVSGPLGYFRGTKGQPRRSPRSRR